ncbi:MAG: MarR family winged helix-turn-helix transcriptional regulator [Anaerolineae bacterium]|nr:MarR family winged helix-turn-helix transcriptional regulator [Anaerolineae bacterium]
MEDNPKRISETISFALARVGIAHRTLASSLLADIGLHVGQDATLQALWVEDKLTQSELAERLCIQLATVNKMISRMEGANLVTKCEDAQDGRVSRVQLTQTGRELQVATEQVWERLEKSTLANFTTEEKIILRRLLHQILENLSQEK